MSRNYPKTENMLKLAAEQEARFLPFNKASDFFREHFDNSGEMIEAAGVMFSLESAIPLKIRQAEMLAQRVRFEVLGDSISPMTASRMNAFTDKLYKVMLEEKQKKAPEPVKLEGGVGSRKDQFSTTSANS